MKTEELEKLVYESANTHDYMAGVPTAYEKRCHSDGFKAGFLACEKHMKEKCPDQDQVIAEADRLHEDDNKYFAFIDGVYYLKQKLFGYEGHKHWCELITKDGGSCTCGFRKQNRESR